MDFLIVDFLRVSVYNTYVHGQGDGGDPMA
jgi:hypothetical protein